MLFLSGPQGCGKSHFVRWLGSVLPQHFVTAPVDFPNLNSMYDVLTQNFVWEVTDIQREDRSDMERFINTPTVTLRKPYQKKSKPAPATASLIATCNDAGWLLSDPPLSPESRQVILGCQIKNIDWAYATEMDPHQVWASAVTKYKEHCCSQSPPTPLPPPASPELEAVRDAIYRNYTSS